MAQESQARPNSVGRDAGAVTPFTDSGFLAMPPLTLS
jgi:hypothetical protein